MQSMKMQRIGVGVAVVNRLMYAIGGFDGQNRLDTVERYHPEKDEWQYVSSMSTKRSGAGWFSLSFDFKSQLGDINPLDGICSTIFLGILLIETSLEIAVLEHHDILCFEGQIIWGQRSGNIMKCQIVDKQDLTYIQ